MLQEMGINYIDEFLGFLREHDKFELFAAELNSMGGKTVLNYLTDKNDPDSWLPGAFPWVGENAQMWGNLQASWMTRLRELKLVIRGQYSECFRTFLNQESCFDAFCTGLSDYRSMSFEEFTCNATGFSPENYIDMATCWEDTEEGSDFWESLHNKWQKLVREGKLPTPRCQSIWIK